jgi:hypothetical protein
MSRKKTVRYVTSTKLLGWPLFSIALGPDDAKDEGRGYARGIIAIGDVATGFIAIGGIAGGAISVGGISLGALSVGGVSLGGAVLGGVAIGGIAFGGVAVGHYAKGGAVVGTYADGPRRHDPEAVRLFNSLIPGGSAPAEKVPPKPADKPATKENASPAEAPDDAKPSKEGT